MFAGIGGAALLRARPAAPAPAARPAGPAADPGRPAGRGGAERAQALVRVGVVFAGIYVVVGHAAGLIEAARFWFFFGFFALFMAVSLVVYAAVLRWPGVYHVRRGFCMALDFGSITLSMIVGSGALAPLHAVLLWVTVGYGMRYGPRYLVAGTICALLSLSAIVALSPFRRGQPYVVMALVITAIIVPIYAHNLLADTRRAHRLATSASLAKSRFLAQASHDLRQPIHAISLFTTCLRDSGLGPEQQEMVGNIDQSLQSLTRRLRSLLDVSTLDSGRIAVRPGVVPLGDLFETVAAQNAEAARRAGVELRVVPTSLRVRTDPNLVAVMLQNLVSNAVKYAPGSRVLVGCRRRGGSAAIVVMDRGPGLTKSTGRTSSRRSTGWRSPDATSRAWASACRSSTGWPG